MSVEGQPSVPDSGMGWADQERLYWAIAQGDTSWFAENYDRLRRTRRYIGRRVFVWMKKIRTTCKLGDSAGLDRAIRRLDKMGIPSNWTLGEGIWPKGEGPEHWCLPQAA